MHSFRVAIKNGHTHSRRIHHDGIIFKNLARFPDHFHFFLGITVVLEHIDVWQYVKGDLFRVNLGFNRLSIQQTGSLAGKFFNRLFTGTGNSLVGRHIDATDTDSILDWF